MIKKDFSFIPPEIPVAIYILDDKQGKNKYNAFCVKQYLKQFSLNIVETYCDYDGIQGSSNRSAFYSMLNDTKTSNNWDVLIIDCKNSIPTNSNEYYELADAMYKSRRVAYIIDKRVKV